MARADMINMLYSKNKSPLEFHFDELIAPPLLTLLSYKDIDDLRRIASSVRLSSKPSQKKKMINDILVPRGFKKLASGTNRVVYKYLEDYSIVLKVAIDEAGMTDSPKEYMNQFGLKPFVTKCFEVSPCGTVGLFERVQPIITRREYLSIAEDVFDMINSKIIGKYVLEDIGSDYFQNIGIRNGFGVVLLDYPYMYELDGNKIYCNNDDPTSPTGHCEGLIDYDIGFNNLICEKCGKRYLARDLMKYNEKNQIIIKNSEREEIEMKIEITRGDTVINTIDTSKDKSSDYIRKPSNSRTSKSVNVPRPSKKDFNQNSKFEDHQKIEVVYSNNNTNGVLSEEIETNVQDNNDHSITHNLDESVNKNSKNVQVDNSENDEEKSSDEYVKCTIIPREESTSEPIKQKVYDDEIENEF